MLSKRTNNTQLSWWQQILLSRRELEYQKSSPTKYVATTRSGYSLVELMVVITVITIVGITSIPNLLNRNDRYLLDSSANQLRQVIIDAATRAQAPDKNDSSGSPQVFQVSFGQFAAPATGGVSLGSVTTNQISLERGLVACDSGDLQGGFSTLRSLTLPRGIYVSSFYPSNQTSPNNRAIIRFAVGEDSFSCGSYDNPAYKSGQLFQGNWLGLDKTNNKTVARYLVVALGSQKVGDKRYVTLDRVTKQVAISRSNPQSYFTPVVDTLTPQWNDIASNNFTLSVACGSSQSEIVISFPRAKDRVNNPSVVDPNLFVSYNIYWTVGTIKQPLAISYFYDLETDIVRYQFTSDLFTNANQPNAVVSIAAVDGLENVQAPFVAPGNLLESRQKSFSNITCGSVISDHETNLSPLNLDQDSREGEGSTCNPILSFLPPKNQRLSQKLVEVLVGRALATPPPFCP